MERCASTTTRPRARLPVAAPGSPIPTARNADATIVFGHWAALGLRLGADWLALDSGCAWGGPLTAVRVEDRRVFQTARID